MKRDAITVAVAQAGGLCYRRGDARDTRSASLWLAAVEGAQAGGFTSRRLVLQAGRRGAIPVAQASGLRPLRGRKPEASQAGGLCYRRGDARDMGGGPSVALY